MRRSVYCSRCRLTRRSAGRYVFATVRRDQVAFITGGASGIGRAIATALAREGARVAVGDVNPDVQAVARDIGAAAGPRVDVTDSDQGEAAIDPVVPDLAGLPILGNIAGIYRKPPVAAMTHKQWDKTP